MMAYNNNSYSTTNKHILILPSWYPVSKFDVNGVFFRDQAIALSSFGYKVGVIAVIMYPLEKLLLFNKIESTFNSIEVDEGVSTYRRKIWGMLPFVPYGNYLLWRVSADKLLQNYFKDHGVPDLIHAHSLLFGGIVAAHWKAQHGIPYVVTEHSTAFVRRILQPWQIRLAEWAAEKADARIAVSPSLSELMNRQFKNASNKWDWIPNIVSERFKPLIKKKFLRDHPIRFLNLALMTKKKGQRDLLEAFALAFGNTSRFELWIGGDGPLMNSLKKKAIRLGIGSQVSFLGRVSPLEVPELFRNIDVMVVASHYETFGVVAAEALMTGTPVLATRCGGPEHIVQEGDGLIVEPNSPELLAKALKEIVTRLPNFDCEAIAQRAKHRFSAEAVVEQLTKIYSQIDRGSGGKR